MVMQTEGRGKRPSLDYWGASIPTPSRKGSFFASRVLEQAGMGVCWGLGG